MFRFTIRDALWLMVVAAAFIIAWQNFAARGALELENKALRLENRELARQERERLEANHRAYQWFQRRPNQSLNDSFLSPALPTTGEEE